MSITNLSEKEKEEADRLASSWYLFPGPQQRMLENSKGSVLESILIVALAATVTYLVKILVIG